MIEVFNKIRLTRIEQGWTQSELAHSAGVGIATLQNIEAGVANPTFDIIKRITDILSISIEITNFSFQIENGISLGLPITTKAFRRQIPTKNKLVQFIRNTFSVYQSLNEREKDAFMSLLLAIKIDFNQIYNELNTPALIRSELNDLSLKGRWIKLRRIALEQLVKYL